MSTTAQPVSILTLFGGINDYPTPLLDTQIPKTHEPTIFSFAHVPSQALLRDMLSPPSLLKGLGLRWHCTNNLQPIVESTYEITAIETGAQIERTFEAFLDKIKSGQQSKRLRFGDYVTITYLPQNEASKDQIIFQASNQAAQNRAPVWQILVLFSRFIDQINSENKFAKPLDLVTALSPHFIQSVKDWIVELEKQLDQKRLAVFNHPFVQEYLSVEGDKRGAFPIELYRTLIAPIVSLADDIYNQVDFFFTTLKKDKNKAEAQEVVGFIHDFRHRVANLVSLGGMWDEDIEEGLPLAVEALVPKHDLESILIGVEVSHRAFAVQKEVLVLRQADDKFSKVTVKKFQFAKLLIRMLSNLVQNGIKYGDHDNASLLLKFVILKIEEDENHLYFSVEDNGLGLSDEDRINIGKKGWRAATVKDIEGNGFGVTNVMNDAKSANGELQIESLEGMGSTFRIKLPKEHFDFIHFDSESRQDDLDLTDIQPQPADFMITQTVHVTDSSLEDHPHWLLPQPVLGGVFMSQQLSFH